MHIHTYTQIHICSHACKHLHAYAHIQIYTHMHPYKHICIYQFTHTYMNTYIHIYMYTHRHANMHISSGTHAFQSYGIKTFLIYHKHNISIFCVGNIRLHMLKYMIKYSSHQSHLHSIQYICAHQSLILSYGTAMKWYNARLTATSFKFYI